MEMTLSDYNTLLDHSAVCILFFFFFFCRLRITHVDSDQWARWNYSGSTVCNHVL